MRKDLIKKIDQSIRLLQLACGDEIVEVAYSGGKDSDTILQLAKEAGIKYRGIYKNTTIDPPGTIKHVRDMGVEILQPKQGKAFFRLVEKKGYPNRMRRFCCGELKEYKVLDKAIIGVRKEESRKRAERYQDPTACRFYGKQHVEQIYPILDWTTEDVKEFLIDRGIKCAPMYYDEEGNFHAERRLGCMCCPLAYKNHRIEEFKAHPQILRAYLRAGKIFMDTHPDSRLTKAYDGDVYAYFVRNLFFTDEISFQQYNNSLLGKPDYKKLLEEYFGDSIR